MGRPSPKCTADFKRRAAGLYRERGCTYAELARELCCDAGSISDWVKRADAAGAAPDRNPFQMAGELRGLRRENDRLRTENEILLKSQRLLRQPSAVGSAAKRAKFAFISANEGSRRVSDMCPAPGAAGRGRCAWRRRGPSAHDLGDAELARPIPGACESSRGIYGAPKVHMEPRRRGFRTSRKRVARIMRDNGRSGTTRGCARRPKGTPKAAAPQAGAAPDLVGRDFAADGPDKARFADITYVRTRRGWPCLALAMDIWPGRAVGWSMSDRMDAGPADEALKMAIARRRPPAGCIHHSDHGSQYVSLRLGRTMGENGIRPSMGGDLLALGQRDHGVADGPRQGGVRARAHLREPRAGGAGDIRVHGVLLQPGADALRARLPRPRGVRGEEPERRRESGLVKRQWNRGRFSPRGRGPND